MALGEVLRSAREHAGLSVDELAHIVNLRPALISAMEENNFLPCGGDTYARGHLRNIARAIGVNPQVFLSVYEEEHSVDSRSIHAQLVDNNAAAIRSENRKLSWKILLGASLSIVVLIGIAQFAMSAIDQEKPSVAFDQPEPSQSASTPVATNASPSQSPATELVPAVNSTLELVIAATRGNSNIDVVVSGVHLYKGPLFQGEEKSFVGDGSISIYLGNAGDLDLTLNGEKLPPLGERNQEIRKTFRAK